MSRRLARLLVVALALASAQAIGKKKEKKCKPKKDWVPINNDEFD